MADSAAGRARRRGASQDFSRWSRRIPWLILLYVAALAVQRLSFSSFLEVDEAEFVGRVDLRWVYDNSHPPLFNWLARGALEATGWNWPLALSAVKYGALAVYHLAVWDLARRMSGPRAALLAVSAAAFLPQVVWMSATTLAHSTLLMAATIGAVWALYRALESAERSGPWTSVWAWFALAGLGLAAGFLTKFNFGLFAVGLLAASLSVVEIRRRLRIAPAALLVALPIAWGIPMLAATWSNLESATGRIEKLYRDGGDLAALDLPLIGIDGFLGMLAALVAWTGPAAAIWAIAFWRDRTRPALPTFAGALPAAFSMVLSRTMALGVAVFAAIILLADMHSVHERYLTPILAVFPVWVAVALPLRRSAEPVVALAAVAYVAVMAGFWAQVSFSKHRFALAYEDLGAAIRAEAPTPIGLRSPRHDDQANALLAAGWPPAHGPQPLSTAERPKDGEVLVIWRGTGAAPGWLAPEGFVAAAAPKVVELTFKNGQTPPRAYTLQRFVGQAPAE